MSIEIYKEYYEETTHFDRDSLLTQVPTLNNFNSILSDTTTQSIFNDVQKNLNIVNIILQEFNRQALNNNYLEETKKDENKNPNNEQNVQIYEVTEDENVPKRRKRLMDYIIKFLAIFKSFSNFMGRKKKTCKSKPGMVVEPDDNLFTYDFAQISRLVALSAFGIALIRSFENVHYVTPFVTFLEEYVTSCLKNENPNC